MVMRIVSPALAALLALASPVGADVSVRARELGYGRGGYSYFVLPSAALTPLYFIDPESHETDQWARADGPLGSWGRYFDAARAEHPDTCPLKGTEWPAETDVLVRQTISVPEGARVELGFAFDNDLVAVRWNGTIIHGAERHEGCAARDTLVVTVPPELIRPGKNVLAVRVRDRGVVGYYDHRITIRSAQ
jgi:hypothetical protein